MIRVQSILRKIDFLVQGRWKDSDRMFLGQDPKEKITDVNATANSGGHCLRGMVP